MTKKSTLIYCKRRCNHCLLYFSCLPRFPDLLYSLACIITCLFYFLICITFLFTLLPCLLFYLHYFLVYIITFGIINFQPTFLSCLPYFPFASFPFLKKKNQPHAIACGWYIICIIKISLSTF